MKKLAILSFLICAGAVARGEESIHLGETVVTSMGFETTLLDEPTNISVITKENLTFIVRCMHVSGRSAAM